PFRLCFHRFAAPLALYSFPTRRSSDLPGGSPTRAIGPFFEDAAGPERSLYFWHYNLAKRSVTADFDTEAGRETFLRLLGTAEVRSEEHTSELQSREKLVCRLLLEKKKT